jgi:hypothetical protein
MRLSNFRVDKIVIHQVFKRNEEGEIVKPLQSHKFTKLEDIALEVFRNRVFEAVGTDSNAVDMQITDLENTGVPTLVDTIVDCDDANFIVSSYDFATKLATVQARRTYPGGIIVIFAGVFGVKKSKFLGVMKAETHNGYEKVENEQTGLINLRYVQDLILTPNSKLYKTAIFLEKPNYPNDYEDLNDKWSVLLSDFQMGNNEGKDAARYFYYDYLGFKYPESSARTTKLFYNSAKKFIQKLDASEELKNDYLNALNMYMKINVSSTAKSSDFSSQYFEPSVQDEFTDYMKEAGVPDTAFIKDITHIKGDLKSRKIKFNNNVSLTAPSDVFKNKIEISQIKGVADDKGQIPEWTQILIKEKIINQE